MQQGRNLGVMIEQYSLSGDLIDDFIAEEFGNLISRDKFPSQIVAAHNARVYMAGAEGYTRGAAIVDLKSDTSLVCENVKDRHFCAQQKW